MKTITIVGTAALFLTHVVPALAAEAKPERETVEICGKTLELMTVEEVRKHGFPYTEVPDGENAATWYIRGANKLHELRDKFPDVPLEQLEHVKRHKWDPDLKELARKIDLAAPALDLYRKGGAKEKCQLPYSKTEMLVGMLLPSLGPARRACELLAYEARRLESKKEFGKAVDNYAVGMRLGCHYGHGRVMIDHLVGIACIAIAGEHAFYGVYRHAYPREELVRFLKELGDLRDDLPDFIRAMKGERAWGLGTVDDLMELGAAGVQELTAWTGRRAADVSPLEKRAIRIILPDRTVKKDMARYYDRMIEMAKIPYHKPEARVPEDKLLAQGKPWNILAGMLLPALGKAREEAEKARVRVDLLRLAIALRIYHCDFGVYPDRLSWLVKEKIIKEVPPDPFSGKPYGYKVEKGHWTAWSVGNNFKDDGGEIGESIFWPEAPDYGLTSKLPPEKDYRPKEGGD
ncbi:MAG: hypothetical protein R6V58_03960 [Planctomycetota bacterium]